MSARVQRNPVRAAEARKGPVPEVSDVAAPPDAAGTARTDFTIDQPQFHAFVTNRPRRGQCEAPTIITGNYDRMALHAGRRTWGGLAQASCAAIAVPFAATDGLGTLSREAGLWRMRWVL
jgi:hypothetical protein